MDGRHKQNRTGQGPKGGCGIWQGKGNEKEERRQDRTEIVCCALAPVAVGPTVADTAWAVAGRYCLAAGAVWRYGAAHEEVCNRYGGGAGLTGDVQVPANCSPQSFKATGRRRSCLAWSL